MLHLHGCCGGFAESIVSFQIKFHKIEFNSEFETFLKAIGLAIDLLAIQEKSLDRALFSYIFIREVRSSGVRTSITIVHIRKFYKM